MSSFDSEAEPVEFENISKLAENIVYLLPGCSDLMVRKTIQETYRDFCRRACCLRARRRFRIDDKPIVVVPMYGGVVDCVAGVERRGRMLRFGVDYYVMDGEPCVVNIGRHFVRHDEEDFVEVETIEIPGITSEVVPAGFIGKYGDYIVSGVLGRIQSMQGRPWSDPGQAAINVQRYENAINEIRSRSFAGNLMAGDSGFSAVDTGVLI